MPWISVSQNYMSINPRKTNGVLKKKLAFEILWPSLNASDIDGVFFKNKETFEKLLVLNLREEDGS